MIECYYMCQSDNGSITESSPARQWSQKYMQSMEATKEPRAGLRLQTLLVSAGFNEVDVQMIRIPLCAWLTGKYMHSHLHIAKDVIRICKALRI